MSMPPRRGPKPKGLPKESAFYPPDWTTEEGYAIQAVMRGTASEEQQRAAMRFVVEKLCATYDWAFRPDQRATDVMLGRQFVGKQLVKFANLNLQRVAGRGKPTEQGETPAEPKE